LIFYLEISKNKLVKKNKVYFFIDFHFKKISSFVLKKNAEEKSLKNKKKQNIPYLCCSFFFLFALAVLRVFIKNKVRKKKK
jgi:hypothetical protein